VEESGSDTKSEGGAASGSGRVAVVALERADQGGSNGTKESVVVAILAEL
jgi:hypothetical protein